MDLRLERKLNETGKKFDLNLKDRARSKKKNWYYYRKITEYYRFFIPEGYRVLEIGSGDGELLAALKPSRGVGIDASAATVAEARARHPHLDMRQGFAETCRLDETFDYLVLSDLVGHLEDVQLAFENLKRATLPSTRLVISYYNYLWEPLLRMGSRLGFRMKQDVQNWLSLNDLENLLRISGYEVIKRTRKVLFPYYIPLVSAFLNKVLANLPLFQNLCLMDFIVARPAAAPVEGPRPGMSVLIPCRNEKGNIEELIRRIPQVCERMELVFVDGRSDDGTREEVVRCQAAYPEKNIRLFDQTGPKGKGPAVRYGFEQCRYEVLVILDSDISVAPEDLDKFYRLLVSGRGEFINGTRMVYQMEKQAMRFLNILGNKFFSLAFTYLLGQPIKDTLCGTKALYKRDYEKIAQNRSFFGDFDPFGDFDLLFGAARLNLQIVEVPVRYYERRYGTTKIHRFRHGLLLLGMCGIALKKLKFV